MRLVIPLVYAVLATGCLVAEPGGGYYTSCIDAACGEVINHAPVVDYAQADCYWDDDNYDDIWAFYAEVTDANGLYDVVEVWADVYDEWDGMLVQSVEVFPTGDALIWYSDWLGSSTDLLCGYPDYTVDVVAYDSLGDMGYQTVVPVAW